MTGEAGGDDLERQAADLMHAAEEAAAATGREMVDEARGVRRRMLDDARRHRDLVRAELERTRRVIDEAIAALDAAEGPPAARPDVPSDGEAADDADAPDAVAEADDTDGDEPSAPGQPGAETDRRVVDAFAALRAVESAPERSAGAPAGADAAPAAPPPAGDPRPAPVDEPADEPEPESAPSGDDATRARRDAVLAPLVAGVVRAAKRLLQDEQNLVLDAGRRARTRLDPSRLLPEPAHHREAWTEVLRPAADAAYSSGRTAVGTRRKPASAPDRLLQELAGTLVSPLRDRLTATVEDVVARGPYASVAEQHRELTTAVGARYREWRARDLGARVDDLLAAAYARGAYDAAASGSQLRWIPDEPGRCPDCDDNALEPTPKGKSFPTGQSHPPAHPGCRCLVVPV